MPYHSWVAHWSLWFNFSFNCYRYHQRYCFSGILLKFCSKMRYSAGRMLASKIAYSARNSAGRIYPNLLPARLDYQPLCGKMSPGRAAEIASLTSRPLFSRFPYIRHSRRLLILSPSPPPPFPPRDPAQIMMSCILESRNDVLWSCVLSRTLAIRANN